MEIEAAGLTDKVLDLGETALAALLCLISEEHCIVEAEIGELDGAEHELRQLCANTFGLSCAVLDCSEETTLDDFGYGILVEDEDEPAVTPSITYWKKEDNQFSVDPTRGQSLHRQSGLLHNGRIANVIVAKNFNLTQTQVQIQALELIRGKRIFSRTSVRTTPKRFLFIALLSTDNTLRLVQHLNDHFFISHFYLPENGRPNFNARKQESDDSSISSVIRSPTRQRSDAIPGTEPTISSYDLDLLMKLKSAVRLSADVRGYLHDVVVFMRMHRAVAGGVSALATRHLHTLVRALAPLHNIDYVLPSFVALAARKIYPHRIVISTPENERSTQWGSSIEAVAEILDGVTAEDIVEEVLQSVEAPL